MSKRVIDLTDDNDQRKKKQQPDTSSDAALARALAAGTPQTPTTRGDSALARQLARPTTEGAARAATLDELRAADKAYDALVAATRSAPLSLSPGTSLTVTQTELLYQHAGVARQIGTAVGAESGPRERDAATFHLRRAARKLALAQALRDL